MLLFVAQGDRRVKIRHENSLRAADSAAFSRLSRVASLVEGAERKPKYREVGRDRGPDAGRMDGLDGHQVRVNAGLDHLREIVPENMFCAKCRTFGKG